MKNKRGDIPVTILVVGIFAVCTLAILSFINSSFILNKSFVGIDIMEKINIDVEENPSLGYYKEYKTTKFYPEFSLDFLRRKVIFSVQYNPNP